MAMSAGGDRARRVRLRSDSVSKSRASRWGDSRTVRGEARFSDDLLSGRVRKKRSCDCCCWGKRLCKATLSKHGTKASTETDTPDLQRCPSRLPTEARATKGSISAHDPAKSSHVNTVSAVQVAEALPSAPRGFLRGLKGALWAARADRASSCWHDQLGGALSSLKAIDCSRSAP